MDPENASEPEAPAAPEVPAAAAATPPRVERRRAPSDQSYAWLMPFSLLVLSIVAVPLLILDEQGLPRYRALKAERVEITAHNAELRREVESLRREVKALRTDPETIERIARDELGMVRPREIVFQFDH